MRMLFFILFCTASVFAQTTIQYDQSTEDFPNPERGFYRYSETYSNAYNPLTVSFLEGLRNSTTVGDGNYPVVSSLVFRYFFLNDFRSGPISQAYLDAMAADFAAVREAGVKIIPRFAYTNEVDSESCNDSFCPPYGDAPKAVVLGHIAQLEPLLQANADVIATLQMGFIGIWGENYYTDFFGDASPQGGQGRLLDENWTDRIEVLNALLAAVPDNRTVSVRYPQMKQKTVYGIAAPTTAAALTEGQAFSGADVARIGFHNDCLLASAYDYGTYVDYGTSAAFGSQDSTNLKPYLAADSRFVPVGGETCDDGNYDPTNNCVSTGGIAEKELRRMHYSYLNAGYNPTVNNDWQDGGCMDDIKRFLGYRFALRSGTFPDQISQGTGAVFSFSMDNPGYAAPYNERRVELLLRHRQNGDVWIAALDEDPRRWGYEAAPHAVAANLCIPPEMPVGDYDLLMHLPDPAPSLYGRPEYSIRLANRVNGGESWESTTGYNDLGHTITVVAGGGSDCAEGIPFVAQADLLPVEFGSLTAEAIGKNVVLHWTTTFEENNDHFRVERSVDGGAFTSIGRLTPRREQRYAYTDEDVVAGQTYLYRIRQVDVSGGFSLSQVVSARLAGGVADLVAFPNPSPGQFTINYDGGDLRVFDAAGRRVPAIRAGRRLQMEHLPTGVYSLELRVGNEVLRGRVVVRGF